MKIYRISGRQFCIISHWDARFDTTMQWKPSMSSPNEIMSCMATCNKLKQVSIADFTFDYSTSKAMNLRLCRSSRINCLDVSSVYVHKPREGAFWFQRWKLSLKTRNVFIENNTSKSRNRCRNNNFIPIISPLWWNVYLPSLVTSFHGERMTRPSPQHY